MKNETKYLWGNRSLYKPKSGSPFHNLHRRGDSLPLPPHVSVDAFNSLRPKGRSCRWQAGRFAPPPRKPYALDKSSRPACICASPKKHASYRDSCFLVAKNMFFHSPFLLLKQCRRSAKARAVFPCPIRYERLSASARRAPEAGEWSPAAWPRRSPGRCAGAPPR